MPLTTILQAYAGRIRNLRRANADVPETGLAPSFQQLLADLLPLLPTAPSLTVVPEFNSPGVGRPDIALKRAGAPARAFVELKAPDKSANPTRWRGHDQRQFERFRELGVWAASNFKEVRLFERDREALIARIVPEAALDPNCDDGRADRLIAAHDGGPLLLLIERLCAGAGQEPVAEDAEHLATLLAHSARLVRGIVRDRLAELHGTVPPGYPLLVVRQTFRDVLYAHPEAGGYTAADFDELFSSAFAQTLAFGLLLVREATGDQVGADAWEHMPPEHPLMRTALRVLSQPEVAQDIGIGLTVMRDTVNSFAPELLAIPPGGPDPILYFYEDFLRTFDPAARERYGVYYTPVQVVRYMVGALDRALRDNLGTEGLRDPDVTILDPATGTGTFLLGVAERVRDEVERHEGAGMAALALQDLAGRMFGFELLVGPYAVAHYRLHHALRQPQGGAEPLALPRLGVYLADTLAQPGAAAAAGALGFVAADIDEERVQANHVKEAQPILAIIGNPPYRRLEEGENRTLVGDWMDELWDDLKQPVSAAGKGNQLNTFPELSVAFWRWAMWKLFDSENAPQRGVVAFITNRKFLTGWPYAGLRKMMRERFDRIEIIDLRGDVRRGERAGVEADQGVFNIQVGTAITLAIADGTKAEGELASITYSDTWTAAHLTRAAKLSWLQDASLRGVLGDGISVDREVLDDFRPTPFLNGELISVRECFEFASSGIETTRDHLAYGFNRDDLQQQLERFWSMENSDARKYYSKSRKDRFLGAYRQRLEDVRLIDVSYRPFDRRVLFDSQDFVDWRRPKLQAAWGPENFGIFVLPSGTNEGPACWCHGGLPDRHAFKGSYGGYVFPFHDNRPEIDQANISPKIKEGLSTIYGIEISDVDVFDSMICMLSSTSYTQRFAEDLEDVFPHVPFPACHAVFVEAARIGSQIRAVQTFARAPAPGAPPPLRLATQPQGAVAAVDYADGGIALCADGSGRLTGLPQAVWGFSVSGYRVLPRWLEARIGQPADLGFVRELRDICGRIAELIELFQAADHVLEAALAEPLTREALGFGPEEDETDGG